MARTRHQKLQQPRPHHGKGSGRQVLVNFWTPWIIAALLVAILGGQLAASAGVDALSNSISLNGNGNRLQQQELPGIEAATAEKQLSHHQNNDDNANDDNQNDDDEADVSIGREQLNYVMQKSKTQLLPNGDGHFEDDEDEGEDTDFRGNGFGYNLLRPQISMGSPLRSLNIVKRAPGGFVGMRGKKSTEGSNEDLSNVYSSSLAFPWQTIPDFDENAMNWEDYIQANAQRYKKAPSVFYGVRGKKFTLGGGIYPGGDAYRWQQFLQKLDEENVRHMIVDDFVDRLVNEPHTDTGALQQQNEMSKRAPTGFTGLRGKRPELTEAGADMSLELLGKRGLSNTFVGVRGKKDVSHQTFKRSPLAGGSESSPNSGPGGKRQRFLDFGNKFVAVRGKKNSLNQNSYEMENLGNNIRWTYSPVFSPITPALNANGVVTTDGSSMRLMYGNTGKRAPNGFVGMRGKRPSSVADLFTAN
ncbi:tachykinins isoform X2 [Musca domestica]|uniref:Tachykinins isoform X2 n=1 Tax=Musca domestica TaxID=7370 RepID=A0ABM3VGV1_MUSDO|nr:tachykinins isoform X2 [Musca domestica]